MIGLLLIFIFLFCASALKCISRITIKNNLLLESISKGGFTGAILKRTGSLVVNINRSVFAYISAVILCLVAHASPEVSALPSIVNRPTIVKQVTNAALFVKRSEIDCGDWSATAIPENAAYPKDFHWSYVKCEDFDRFQMLMQQGRTDEASDLLMRPPVKKN